MPSSRSGAWAGKGEQVQGIADLWVANRDFLELGGNVLVAILLVTFLMWALILERYWYFRTAHVQELDHVLSIWKKRSEHHSWFAKQIRDGLISRISIDANRNVGMIKTLVALCPLLGLLGTVTGMVEVFEVMAQSGSGNPRAMASGVSKATIPTMAGMVAAISGYIPSVALERRVRTEVERVSDQLSPEEAR